jgi:hypothetical protein
MPTTISTQLPEHAGAVREFNARLAAGGQRYRFPVSPVPEWLPPAPGRRLFQEHFLALDADTVRGGYILKRQDFLLDGETCVIGNYQLPLAEGLIDKRFAAVGLQLLLDCMRRQPLLYCLGIGGHEESLTKMLGAARWGLWDVPFFFKVLRPASFLRHMRYLRKTPVRRLALDVAAATGLGSLALVAQAAAGLWQRGGRPRPAFQREVVGDFDGWVDEVWARGAGTCRLAGVRDLATLRVLYPASDARFARLRVRAAGETVGWAVCLTTSMHEHAYFGDMRLGTLVDCFAVPGEAPRVVLAAAEHLETAGADLVVTNQAHDEWCRALAAGGFLPGPSNFIFATSPALAARLGSLDAAARRCHLTRGDGDGPIHL